jgi:hypothetical protein
MKFKINVSICLFIVSLMLVGCSKETLYPNSKMIDAATQVTNDMLSYEEYEKLFEYIVKSFKVDGLVIKASTLGENLTILDKDLSFNKRTHLTLDGSFSQVIAKPTDEYIILENKDQSKQVTIGMFFTNSYLGNDLIGWPTNAGFGNLNEHLANGTNYAVLSYKNLIITVHQSSTDKIYIELTKTSIRSIINELNEYKHAN